MGKVKQWAEEMQLMESEPEGDEMAWANVKEFDAWANRTRVQRVKEILIKYLEPKPEYNGMSADEIAKMVVEEVKI